MTIFQLFSQDEVARIEAAIAAAEKQTEGEIVPMVVATSDAYPAANLRFAIVFAGVLSCIATYYLPHVLGYLTFALWFFPLLTLGLLIISFIPKIKKPFLNSVEVERETFERAVFEFSHHKVYKTKERTGILIYLSILERRVIVLADEGINAKVEPEMWNTVVKELVASIKEGRMAEGLEVAIAACGKSLAQHFPAGPENVNQLRNRLIVRG